MQKIILENKEFVNKIIRNNRYLSFMDNEIKNIIVYELTIYPIKDILDTRYEFSCTERHLIPKKIKESKSFHLKNFTNHI